MSHELRTPLTAIIGYERCSLKGSTARSTTHNGKQLDRIKVSARQLLALIEEVLLYARVEAGRESRQRRTKCARSRWSRRRLDDRGAAGANPAALAHRERDRSGAQRCGPTSGKLRQMLINLLANAVKFTERGASPCVRTPRRRRRLRGSGYGHRHRAGEPRAHLRGVLAGRAEQDAAGRGERARAEYDATARQRARRRRLRGERTGCREHVSHRAAEGATLTWAGSGTRSLW